MAIYAGYFQAKYAQKDAVTGLRKAEYLFQAYNKVVNAPTSGSDIDADANRSKIYSSAIAGLITFFYYFILLNTLIPISLVVSLEFVKLIQTPFM